MGVGGAVSGGDVVYLSGIEFSTSTKEKKKIGKIHHAYQHFPRLVSFFSLELLTLNYIEMCLRLC